MFNYVFAKQIGLINYFLKGPIIRIKKKIICNEIFKFKTITNKEYLIHKDRKFNSISKIGKLPGGSSNETWVINYFDNNKEEKIILRCHHSGIKDKSNIYPPLSLSIEASVMEIAYNNNIPVPKIIYKLNNKSIFFVK